MAMITHYMAFGCGVIVGAFLILLLMAIARKNREADKINST